MEKISVIVPTHNREKHVLNLIGCFLAQTYPNTELRIHDDSEHPSAKLAALCEQHPMLHYTHSSQRLSIGEKRNALIKASSGELIAHFDDDDYYAPNYLAAMYRHLTQNNLDFTTLSNWFAYSLPFQTFAYWETDRISPCHYRINQEGVSILPGDHLSSTFPEINPWGYGFSYFFKRQVHQQVQYKPMNHNEDYDFYARLKENGFQTGCFPDKDGLVLHLMHHYNTSQIFPQYILPNILLDTLFGDMGSFLAKAI